MPHDGTVGPENCFISTDANANGAPATRIDARVRRTARRVF
jgi:hypothetical protein